MFSGSLKEIHDNPINRAYMRKFCSYISKSQFGQHKADSPNLQDFQNSVEKGSGRDVIKTLDMRINSFDQTQRNDKMEKDKMFIPIDPDEYKLSHFGGVREKQLLAGDSFGGSPAP